MEMQQSNGHLAWDGDYEIVLAGNLQDIERCPASNVIDLTTGNRSGSHITTIDHLKSQIYNYGLDRTRGVHPWATVDLLLKMGLTTWVDVNREDAKKDLYQGHPRPWREIDEETYDWLLGAVPPALMLGLGFVNSEAMVDDIEGRTYYMTCRTSQNQYWYRLSTIQEFRDGIYGPVTEPLPPAKAKMFSW